jgi:hypothetical protein
MGTAKSDRLTTKRQKSVPLAFSGKRAEGRPTCWLSGPMTGVKLRNPLPRVNGFCEKFWRHRNSPQPRTIGNTALPENRSCRPRASSTTGLEPAALPYRRSRSRGPVPRYARQRGPHQAVRGLLCPWCPSRPRVRCGPFHLNVLPSACPSNVIAHRPPIAEGSGLCREKFAFTLRPLAIITSAASGQH